MAAASTPDARRRCNLSFYCVPRRRNAGHKQIKLPKAKSSTVDGSGTADEPPPGSDVPPKLDSPGPDKPSAARKLDVLEPNGLLGASEPANAKPLAVGLPAASDGAIVTAPGLVAVPPITKAFWIM